MRPATTRSLSTTPTRQCGDAKRAWQQKHNWEERAVSRGAASVVKVVEWVGGERERESKGEGNGVEAGRLLLLLPFPSLPFPTSSRPWGPPGRSQRSGSHALHYPFLPPPTTLVFRFENLPSIPQPHYYLTSFLPVNKLTLSLTLSLGNKGIMPLKNISLVD